MAEGGQLVTSGHHIRKAPNPHPHNGRVSSNEDDGYLIKQLWQILVNESY